jgi:hypothetical protein
MLIQTSNALRDRAEKMIASRPHFSLTAERQGEARLLHEVEVYQIELELQNDALIEALCAASLAQEKTEALYDLAPVGFFNLNEDRLILEANKRGTSMLGLTDAQAVGRHLSAYIAGESLNVWEAIFQGLSFDDEQRSSEPLVINRGAHHLPIYAHAIARKIADPDTGGATTQMIWMDVSLEYAAREDALRALKRSESRGELFSLPRPVKK